MAPLERSKFGAPMFELELFRKQTYGIEGSTWDFSESPAVIRRPPQWFGAPIVIRRPGSCSSLAPPRYAPAFDVLYSCWKRVSGEALSSWCNSTSILFLYASVLHVVAGVFHSFHLFAITSVVRPFLSPAWKARRCRLPCFALIATARPPTFLRRIPSQIYFFALVGYFFFVYAAARQSMFTAIRIGAGKFFSKQKKNLAKKAYPICHYFMINWNMLVS